MEKPFGCKERHWLPKKALGTMALVNFSQPSLEGAQPYLVRVPLSFYTSHVTRSFSRRRSDFGCYRILHCGIDWKIQTFRLDGDGFTQIIANAQK